jgi:hypothetical protein
MGKRRMLCTDITRSDAFLEMPQSSRLLYYDLCQEGDDEGFVSNPKSIMRLTGATDDDMRVLLMKKFVILPDKEKGIVVIKHWYIHNYIRKDRMVETNYKDLKALLDFDENGAYTMTGKCLPHDGQVSAEDKLSKDKTSKKNIFTPPTLEEVMEYCSERKNNVDPKKFYEYYSVAGWKDSKGNQVKNWKQKMIANWEKDKPKTEESVPVYDSKSNAVMDVDEENELLKLMGRK